MSDDGMMFPFEGCGNPQSQRALGLRSTITDATALYILYVAARGYTQQVEEHQTDATSYIPSRVQLTESQHNPSQVRDNGNNNLSVADRAVRLYNQGVY